MPEWPQIIRDYGELVWRLASRMAADADPPARFRDTFMAAREAAHRDAVSDWPMLLQYATVKQCLAALREGSIRAGLAGQLRHHLAGEPEQRGTVFALRYFCGFSYPVIAMVLRAPLETIGPMVSETCTSLGRQLLATQRVAAEPSTELADDLLERAVAEVNGAPVPPLDEALVRDTTQALLAAPETPFEKPPEKSRALPLSIVAAIIVIILSVIGVRIYNREPPPAFAIDAVTAAIAEREAVSYRLTRSTELADGRTRRLDAEIVSRAEGQLRQVMRPPEGTIIWDFQEGKALTLDESRNRAVLRDVSDMLDHLRPVDAWPLLKGVQQAQPTVQRTIQGRRAQGFEAENDGTKLKLWADLKTHLPVLVEASFAEPAATALLSDFNWSPTTDATMFALEPPQGYELTAQRANLRATEIDLLRALDIAARYNGGKYPERFDRTTVAPLLEAQQARLPADRNSAEYQAASERLDAELWQLGRGFQFIADNGEDWHYASGEVFVSSRDPVLWYRPVGSNTYRVINGALDVRVVPGDRLPTVPAKRMQPTTQPQRLGL